MTPEILRNARQARQQKKNAAEAVSSSSSNVASGSSADVNKTVLVSSTSNVASGSSGVSASRDGATKTVSLAAKKFKDHLKANRILAGVSQVEFSPETVMAH